MAFTIANPHAPREWNITPDGEGRYTEREITIDSFPEDPETHEEVDEFFVKPNELGLPYIESAEVEANGVEADFDDATASIRISKGEDKGTVKVTAYGPPEFSHVHPD